MLHPELFLSLAKYRPVIDARNRVFQQIIQLGSVNYKSPLLDIRRVWSPFVIGSHCNIGPVIHVDVAYVAIAKVLVEQVIHTELVAENAG